MANSSRQRTTLPPIFYTSTTNNQGSSSLGHGETYGRPDDRAARPPRAPPTRAKGHPTSPLKKHQVVVREIVTYSAGPGRVSAKKPEPLKPEPRRLGTGTTHHQTNGTEYGQWGDAPVVASRGAGEEGKSEG